MNRTFGSGSNMAPLGNPSGMNNFNDNLDGNSSLGAVKKNPAPRRVVDLNNGYNRYLFYLKNRIVKNNFRHIQRNSGFTSELLPPTVINQMNMTGVLPSQATEINTMTKLQHLSNKKHVNSINTVKFTPTDGRRLLVAKSSGEFMLFNADDYSFETIMQAHDAGITACEYSNSGDWLVSGDMDGIIKIWQQPSLNLVKQIDPRNAVPSGPGGSSLVSNRYDELVVGSIRDISFNWDDSRFISCGDDKLVKIWNFQTGQLETTLKGHHWDVRTCDWHKEYGLVVSGSKDNLIKLWDPRSGKVVSTLLGYKHTVLKTKFTDPSTNKLISVGKDKTCRIYDLRNNCREYKTYKEDLNYISLELHPVQKTTFIMGTYDGQIKFYDFSKETLNESYHTIPHAHEQNINTLSVNPRGHMLASGSRDRSIRFWTRGRPYDPNAFDEPVYNNEKINGWYYGINNGPNAVRQKTDHGVAVPENDDLQGTTTNFMPNVTKDKLSSTNKHSKKTDDLEDEYVLPGLG
ncbi:hypothetical protein ACO0RG_000360 [Hanseniaspora osmophila]|uniref:Polyadenylation factor subunit 2 n=1 Tax=Hanseniaspora osmophila TaxID=56408 RepID=A0A1E5R6I3_9ASCO|nr:Polyadenylation factor subunit 2 [Hanseniaspora osmophila]